MERRPVFLEIRPRSDNADPGSCQAFDDFGWFILTADP
jgi:hypothetical protein